MARFGAGACIIFKQAGMKTAGIVSDASLCSIDEVLEDEGVYIVSASDGYGSPCKWNITSTDRNYIEVY